jgi:hypothetical protein
MEKRKGKEDFRDRIKEPLGDSVNTEVQRIGDPQLIMRECSSKPMVKYK